MVFLKLLIHFVIAYLTLSLFLGAYYWWIDLVQKKPMIASLLFTTDTNLGIMTFIGALIWVFLLMTMIMVIGTSMILGVCIITSYALSKIKYRSPDQPSKFGASVANLTKKFWDKLCIKVDFE